MRKHLTFAVLLAMAAGASAQEKEQPPAGGTPKPFTVPARQTATLKNGTKVTLVPYGSLPKVTVVATIRAGNINEMPKQVWLADVLGELMKEGAGSRNGEQVALEAARMGGQLSITVGPEETQVSADVLSEFAPDLVKLIADVVQRPTLPASELERIKKNRLRQLAVERSTPQALADEAFYRTLYPDHPFGRLFPTEEMINGFTIEDVRNFYKGNFGGARTRIYVSGRFDPGVLKTIASTFEGWPAGPAVATNVPKPRKGRSLAVIDRPGAAQSTLRVGIPVLNPKDPDYVPFVLTNSLLGGSFASRITSNIREQKGYTYSPNSVFVTHYRDGAWIERADVTTSVTGPALKEILFEVSRLREAPPSDQELKGMQNYLAGTFVLSNSSRRGIINQLSFVDFHELGDNFLKNYVPAVHAVKGTDVQRLTETYLDPQKMEIVVVGDKSKISDQMQPFQP